MGRLAFSLFVPVFLEDDEHEEAYEIVVTLLFVLVVVLVLDNMVT